MLQNKGRAYYILKRGHLNRPQDFAHIEVFVCSPSLALLHTNAFKTFQRDLLQEGRPRYYLAAENLWVWLPAHLTRNPYYKLKGHQMKGSPQFLLRNVRAWTGTNGNLVPAYLPDPDFSRKMVDFHAAYTFKHGLFDGMYFDDCWHRFPRHMRLNIQEAGYDQPDDMLLITSRFIDWRRAYISHIRAAFPEAMLLGNIGHEGLIDANLDGLCLESIGTRYDRKRALEIIVNHRLSSPGRNHRYVGWNNLKAHPDDLENLEELFDPFLFGEMHFKDIP